MRDGSLAFEAIRRAVRRIPDRLRGKTRLARFALRPFLKSGVTRIPDAFGNVLDLPSLEEPISVGLFAFGIYEPDTHWAILRYLPASGVLVDVGANVGAVAIPAAACRSDARIICVEADPHIVTLLRRNVTQNRRSNIDVINCLAGAVDDAQVPFYRAPTAKFGMGSIGPQFGARPVNLTQRILDRVLDELAIDDIDVVKFDIEGAELGPCKG
jgi:FkbM family methyltransferase